jgi:hypothetical protein
MAIANAYTLDDSINDKIRYDKRYPYHEESLCLLSNYLVHLDSNTRNQTNNLSNEDLDYLLYELYIVESGMAIVIISRSQLDVAEGHCQRSLTYSRRIGVEGEMKTSAIYRALYS